MSYCQDCKQELRIGGPRHECVEGRIRKAREESPSRSLDVFKDWEQFRRIKITGYTLRDGTDVCHFSFSAGKPSGTTADHMVMLITQGWQITAIHYEDSGHGNKP